MRNEPNETVFNFRTRTSSPHGKHKNFFSSFFLKKKNQIHITNVYGELFERSHTHQIPNRQIKNHRQQWWWIQLTTRPYYIDVAIWRLFCNITIFPRTILSRHKIKLIYLLLGASQDRHTNLFRWYRNEYRAALFGTASIGCGRRSFLIYELEFFWNTVCHLIITLIGITMQDQVHCWNKFKIAAAAYRKWQ